MLIVYNIKYLCLVGCIFIVISLLLFLSRLLYLYVCVSGNVDSIFFSVEDLLFILFVRVGVGKRIIFLYFCKFLYIGLNFNFFFLDVKIGCILGLIVFI